MFPVRLRRVLLPACRTCWHAAMTPRARSLLAFSATANLLQNLLFPVLAVRALGVGAASDALFMVFVLPGVVTVLLANSVLNWLAPRLVHRPDDASRRVLCWSLLWVLLAGVTGLCAALWLAASLVLSGHAEADSFALAASVLPLGLAAVLMAVIAALAQALFTAERDVPGAEWRTLLGKSTALLLWLWVEPATLTACALLFTLRALCVATLLAPRLGRPLRGQWQDADLRGILRESRWLLVAATYYKSEPFVDRLLFASAPGGAVAAYHLATQVLAVVTQLMQRLVAAPLVAPLAEAAQAGDAPGMRRLFFSALWRCVLVGLVLWAAFALGGEKLLGWLLAGTSQDAGHDAAQTALTAQMLVILGGFMLAVLIGQITAQMYYCTGSTRQVVILSVLAYTLGLVLKVLALWQFGMLGLVAAVSVSWLLNVAMFGAFIPGILRRVAARAV